MPIRAVTFDFWGTLYRDTVEGSARRRDRRVRQIESFLATKNVAITTREVREALVAVEHAATDDHHAGQGTWTQTRIGRAVAEQLACDLDDDGIRTLGAAVTGAVVHHPPELFDGAVETLEALEGRYRMAVICNARLSVGSALRQVMGNDLVLEYFETQSFSNEAPVSKPAPHPFLRTIELMGVPPAQAVHVGDSEKLDVQGAKEAGMRAVLIRRRVTANHSRADAVVESLADLPAALEAMT